MGEQHSAKGRGFSRLKSLFVLFFALVLVATWYIGIEYSALDAAPTPVSHGLRGSDALHAYFVEDDFDTLYPERIFEINWVDQVPVAELVHLGVLHRACITHRNSIIPWDVGGDDGHVSHQVVNETDANLLTVLRQCPDVDIFIPDHIRSHGYCEDAVAYTKFLQSRMLPAWVMTKSFFDKQLNRNVTYHDLCPKTPMLFLNHYWDGVREDSAWPATKPMYLMPNIEMHELDAKHYWLSDVVLCKTAICARYLTKWFEQEGNPRNTTVLFTRHTSSDVATTARTALGNHGHAPKDFDKPVFVHTAGTSIQKGTARVLDCWLSRPDLPLVDIYIGDSLYDGAFKKSYGARIEKSANIHVHKGKLDDVAFGKVIVESAFFLCTSIQEGYGHYINHARASGGLVLTPDVPPMNELITETSGVRIAATARGSEHMFLSGQSKHELGLRNVTGFIAHFNGGHVCAAVDTVMAKLSSSDRQRRAERGRQQYFYDTLFFGRKMEWLREFAQRGGVDKVLDS